MEYYNRILEFRIQHNRNQLGCCDNIEKLTQDSSMTSDQFEAKNKKSGYN